MEKDQYKEYLFFKGEESRAYDYFGVHLSSSFENYEYTFRVWAQGADSVSLISDFTDWEGGLSMEKGENGIFYLKILSKCSLEGKKYKYLVKKGDRSVKKGDPYAKRSMGYDDGASVIYCEESFVFSDREYLRKRRSAFKKKGGYYLPHPINIYEVHLESFYKKEDGSFLSYPELSKALVPYIKMMGYTHVELLPITEYPYGGSWGYQVGAFFAPSCRFGSPLELKAMINAFHNEGIGVILDFVPAHFPKDEWGLFEFDTTPTYEYSDEKRMDSPSWGTRFFDLGKGAVRSFLLSAALYYLREFHFDGLRIDAVSAMIYLDHDRNDGTEEGQCTEGVEFLKLLNTSVFSEFSDVLMIAEESRAFSGVTRPVNEDGLGFNLKWNMGFANDLYDYLSTDPLFRKYKHEALTFPISYAFGENYILPLSHDETVHGKLSFIDKCYGSYEDKFKTLRTAMLMIMTYPGKKLLFMGAEFAQFREWDALGSLEWFMLDYEKHWDFREYLRALNNLYLSRRELYEIDFSGDGFSWIDCENKDSSAVSYIRRSIKREELIVALNFSGATQTISLGRIASYKVVFSTEENVVELLTNGEESFCKLSGFSGVILEKIPEKINVKI